MKYKYIYQSPVGNLELKSDGDSITGLILSEQSRNLPQKNKNLKIFQKAIEWLDTYFQGKEPKEKLALKMQGTDFQKEVWNLLLKIPYGQVITYKELAEVMAIKRDKKKMSAQAIGNAVHNNPIPIIVPCHRVVGQKKNLVGYGLGTDLKINLLKLEGLHLKEYYFYKEQKKQYVEESDIISKKEILK